MAAVCGHESRMTQGGAGATANAGELLAGGSRQQRWKGKYYTTSGEKIRKRRRKAVQGPTSRVTGRPGGTVPLIYCDYKDTHLSHGVAHKLYSSIVV